MGVCVWGGQCPFKRPVKIMKTNGTVTSSVKKDFICEAYQLEI